jgi:L-threonylcarbamoyladenylate synthase
MILDGGACSIGVESTILDLTAPVPCILRAGGTAIEDLEPIIGKLNRGIEPVAIPRAPGQLARHYATHTKLEIADEAEERIGPDERVGLIALTCPPNPDKYDAVEVLSPSGDLREAAANLFRALRQLDALSLDRIIARPVREERLGLAIMDRLRRCAAHR